MMKEQKSRKLELQKGKLRRNKPAAGGPIPSKPNDRTAFPRKSAVRDPAGRLQEQILAPKISHGGQYLHHPRNH